MGRKWAELAVARRGGSGKPYQCALNSLPASLRWGGAGGGRVVLVAPLSTKRHPILGFSSPLINSSQHSDIKEQASRYKSMQEGVGE